MSNINGTPEASEKSTAQQSPAMFQSLKSACRTAKQKSLLVAVWQNNGILTHELHRHVFANNLHDISASVNQYIQPLGWRIIKTVASERSASYAWHLAPVNACASEG
jgi:hypothetical protein